MIEFVYEATRHYKGANVEKGFCKEQQTEDVKREEKKRV